MKACHCEQPAAPAGDRGPRSGSWWRANRSAAGWVIPGTVLVLMPKCPACVVGYVVVATGLGISLQAAAALRWTLVAMCVVVLAFTAVRRLRRGGRGTRIPASK